MSFLCTSSAKHKFVYIYFQYLNVWNSRFRSVNVQAVELTAVCPALAHPNTKHIQGMNPKSKPEQHSYNNDIYQTINLKRQRLKKRHTLNVKTETENISR